MVFIHTKLLFLMVLGLLNNSMLIKVWLNRYSWAAGKQGSGYVSWFRRFVQIRLKIEAGDCPPLNINATRATSVKSYLKHLSTVRLTIEPENMEKGQPFGFMPWTCGTVSGTRWLTGLNNVFIFIRSDQKGGNYFPKTTVTKFWYHVYFKLTSSEHGCSVH